LSRYFSRLHSLPTASVLVPLCGKSLDIHWLLAQGHHVYAIDLSEIAILALLDELALGYQRQTLGDLIHFQAQQLDVFVGDVFDLSPELLKQMQANIDVVYDRAALVALPPSLHARYVQHIVQLSQNCPQLLINYAYPQQYFAGPPFALSDQAILELYQPYYRHIKLLAQQALHEDEPLAQKIPKPQQIFEKIWCIQS
jgi:thiopurine S-methyltransferase